MGKGLTSVASPLRSFLIVLSKILHAQIHCERMEKLCAMGQEAMCGDDDINFDL